MKQRFILQQGYFLFLAVIFIMVMGVMGVLIAYMQANRAKLGIAQLNGFRTLYIAESGLEIGTRLLTLPSLSGTPSRVACGSMTGLASVTNAAMGNGTFTITTFNSAPTYSVDTLSSALNSTDTTISATSTSGFAPSGKIMIDRELINYAAISGNTFIGVTRGVSGTLAAAHAVGADISQFQCSISAKAGIPNLSSPQYQRELQWNVQLEDAWAVGVAISGSVWNLVHWNIPTELQWTQQTPAFGSTKQLNAVSMLSSADVWAVGNSAAALHYDGSTWTTVNTGIAGGDNLLSVSAVSSNEAWACVSQGKVYKWSGGTTWSVVATPGNSSNSISMVDTNGNGTADAGWVVGTKKTAYVYNGSTWSSSNTGITVDLNGVSTLSASEAWAVGNSGQIYRWNGSSWSTISSPTAAVLNSVSMMQWDSSTIGWAAGASSALLYYNGSSWSLQNTGISGSLTFNSVVVVSPNEAWAVTSTGLIYEWNGSTWTLKFTSTKQLFGIDALRVKNNPQSTWRQIFR